MRADQVFMGQLTIAMGQVENHKLVSVKTWTDCSDTQFPVIGTNVHSDHLQFAILRKQKAVKMRYGFVRNCSNVLIIDGNKTWLCT